MTPLPVTIELLARSAPLPMPESGSDKNTRGRVLVVGGSSQVPGAPILTGLAALHAGAGKLQLAAPYAHVLALGMPAPEARVIGADATPTGDLGEISAAALHEAASQSDAIIIGPGMMDPIASAALAKAMLAVEGDAGFVLDAAAMTGLEPKPLGEGRAILTPHAGEMAHLLGTGKEEIDAAPLDSAIHAASVTKAVVVMKGATTFVAAPDGRVWSHEGGVIGLATSGSGDVLAGVIGGLLARGVAPAEAALWGVCLHGEAGRRLSGRIGAVGFLARELLPEITLCLP